MGFRKHKFSAVGVRTGDGYFPSKKELRVWEELKLLQKAGSISNLSRNRKDCTFELHGLDGTVVCKYIADYIFVDNGRSVCGDAKGMKTDVYSLKRKLFLAEHGQNWEHREM